LNRPKAITFSEILRKDKDVQGKAGAGRKVSYPASGSKKDRRIFVYTKSAFGIKAISGRL
jgi:hypothetical protein